MKIISKKISRFSHTVSLYWRLMRFDRPIGILLLLWPTLWGLWLASDLKIPDYRILLVFVLGVISMRAAGCVVNDMADRRFDRHVARTKNRPLACNALSMPKAFLLFFLLCGISLSLVLTLHASVMRYAVVGLGIAVVYPFAKRYMPVPQCVLGLAFAWGIPLGFIAVRDAIPGIAWLLFVATFFWIMAYDTQYAMMDREEDLKIAVQSSAIYFGRFVLWWIVGFQFIMLLLLMEIGIWASLHLVYFVALIIVMGLFIYQYRLVQSGIQSGTATSYRKAFLNNQWVGLMIFFGIAFS